MPDRESVYLHRVYQKTWNPPSAKQKVDVHMCECECVSCAFRINSSAARSLTVSQLRLGVTSFVWSLASSSRPAPLPRLGREVDRETARASERAALTSGACYGNNGDAPQGDSGRQEQAQTQEPSILPVRQTCRGLRI